MFVKMNRGRIANSSLISLPNNTKIQIDNGWGTQYQEGIFTLQPTKDTLVVCNITLRNISSSKTAYFKVYINDEEIVNDTTQTITSNVAYDYLFFVNANDTIVGKLYSEQTGSSQYYQYWYID